MTSKRASQTTCRRVRRPLLLVLLAAGFALALGLMFAVVDESTSTPGWPLVEVLTQVPGGGIAPSHSNLPMDRPPRGNLNNSPIPLDARTARAVSPREADEYLLVRRWFHEATHGTVPGLAQLEWFSAQAVDDIHRLGPQAYWSRVRAALTDVVGKGLDVESLVLSIERDANKKRYVRVALPSAGRSLLFPVVREARKWVLDASVPVLE